MKVTGTLSLHGQPEPRLTKTGEPYIATTCREGNADAAPLWVRVFAFDAEVRAALGRATPGDLLHVTGQLKLGTYAKDGETRLGVTIVAAAVQLLEVCARLPAGVEEIGWDDHHG